MFLKQTTKFKITRFVNKFLLPLLVYSSVVLVFTIMVYSVFFSSLEQKEIINISIVGFATLSILIAYKQITISADLQRRQVALEKIDTISKSNKKHRDELNQLIDYVNIFKEASLNSMSISRENMKNYIFEKDNQGNFIGHGSKELPHTLTNDGRKIVTHIVEIFNNFEMMAIGIINNVYDERVMKDYFEEIIKKNYIVHNDFLNYLKTEAFLNDQSFCENYEWLYNQWNKKPLKIMR